MDTLKIRIAAKSRPKRTMEELILAAKEKDAKMDRSRKTPTKELKATALLNAMLNYEDTAKTAEDDVEVETPKGEWDVKIGDPIEFFDPLLSYELTGYRPITKDQGLDFDPKLFTEAADSFRKNGRYTMYAPGTFKNKLFWTQEWDRCCNGCTIGKYRLTGLNYFWLNYYRLESNISDDSSDDQIRVEDFPGFLAKLYEYFHYLELVKILKKDALIFKARGVN